MRQVLKIAMASAALGLASVPAHAAEIIACGGGSNCLTGTTNVNLVSAQGTQEGTGTVGVGGPAVTFTTAEPGGLDLDASGQATITAGDAGTLTSLTFQILTGFTAAEFNLSPFTGGGQPVQFGVTFTSNEGITTQSTFFAPLGDQRFAIVAGANETLTRVTLTSEEGFGRFTQLRVGTDRTVGPVPEPGTWAMMLLGFGAMGAGLRRSRRRNTTRILQLA